MEEKNALMVSNLTLNYDKTPVLWDVSCNVPVGSIAGLIGPNGAGKSTLIKSIVGMLKPISGKVECLGRSFKAVRRKIAYVPQKESVDWDFPITVLELVLMGCYGRLGVFCRPRRADKDAAMHYLSLVGMENYANRQISQLSGGQQQRAFIARALLQEAELYFMDEPFAGIDAATEQVIMELLHDLKKSGKTILIVHHGLSTVSKYFDWLIVLNMSLIACGRVDDVFNKDIIDRAYGKNNIIFGEAIKLSQDQSAGMI